MSSKGLVKTKSFGRVEYGERAFDQDANEAMKGDIVRGLIETITNSDDAYGREKGKIRIEVEHRRGDWKAITQDRACGMRVDRMIEVFAKLGGRTSGFEHGAEVRGNLGRGAKDLAAFGEVEFESVREGVYSRMILKPTGEYEADREQSATPEIRQRLGIGKNGSGTTVTVHCKGVRCPQHRTLKDKLQQHYQLRDILSDPDREVLLVDPGTDKQETLRYMYPQLETVFSGELDIPGYDAAANVTIYRNIDRHDEPSTDSGRPAGLLIKGRRAVYENTLFGFERNAYAGWFSGRIECPAVDDMAVEYDQRREAREDHPENNPTPIITRRRDGLEPTHPFYKALAAAVEVPLGELVAAEEERARSDSGRESAAMRRTLDALGRNLAKLIDEDLKEADEEDGLFGGDGADGTQAALQIIPERAVLYMGEDKTLSVLVRGDLPDADLHVEVDPQGVVELVTNDGDLELVPHKKRADVRVARVRLRPLIEGGETMLAVTYGEEVAYAIIEVREEREIEIEERPAPDGIEFERELYRVRHGKTKRIELAASLEAVALHGTTATVTSTDSGIVVLGQRAELTFNEEYEFYTGTIEVDARSLGARATLVAALGDESAQCQMIVSADGDGPGLRIKLVGDVMGNNRAIRERDADVLVIKILGGHPALKRYLGAPTAKGGFEGEDHTVTKALIAEIVAETATRIVMEKKSQLLGELGDVDAAAFYAEHTALLTRYLKRCHRALVPATL